MKNYNYVNNEEMYNNLKELRLFSDYDPEVFKIKKKNYKGIEFDENNSPILTKLDEDKKLEIIELMRKDKKYKEFCDKRFVDETIDEKKARYSKIDKIKNRLGKMFLLICEGQMKLSNFTNYSDDRKGDMISEATWAMSRYMNRYNLEKTNPFAYFSTVCFNAFIHRIDEQKKHTKRFKPLSFIDNLDGEEFSLGESNEY